MSYSHKTATYLAFILACMSLMVSTGIGRFVFTPILPIMLTENTVEMSEVIWLSSANYIGYFFGAMSLFKNNRHILMLILGLITVTVATFLSASSDFYTIFAFRFLAGIGGAWALVSASAWAVPWLTQLDVKRVGFIYTGVGAGIALSGIVCSILILQDWTATELWYAVSIISLVLTILIISALHHVINRYPSIKAGLSSDNDKKDDEISTVVLEEITAVTIEDTSDKSTDQENDSINQSNTPAVWRLALAYGLFGFGYIIPATFLPKIAKDMLEGNAFLLVWPVFGIASVISVIAVQFLKNVSDMSIWRIAQLVLGVATLLPVFSESITTLIMATLLIGGSFMLVIMSILKIASRIPKAYNLSALVTTCFAFGQLAGPLPALLFQGVEIWHYILPLSAFSSLLGAAIIWNIKVD